MLIQINWFLNLILILTDEIFSEYHNQWQNVEFHGRN